MSTNNAFLYTKDNITIVANGRSVIVQRSFAEFTEVEAALKRQDFEGAIAAADRGEAIRNRSKGEFQVLDGIVYRDGVPVHNVITDRILQFVDNGLPFGSLTLFYENLMSNPSARAVSESYAFLEHNNMPITTDGCFLAYKSVNSNYFSKAGGRLTLLSGRANSSGQIYNGVGEKIECLRNEVDDDKDRTCSKGLHVGSLEYSGPNGWYHSSGDKIVIVKVNPRDIVSVPNDENATKLRVCAYEVVDDFKGAMSQPLFTKTATPFNVGEGAEDVTRRCRDCRERKKASTFTVAADVSRPTCPRCGSRRTFKL